MNLQPTFEAVLALCDDRANESHSLEFKAKQPGKLEQDKAEFAKDVSALANRGGGLLIYGISENDGAAEGIVPITDEDPDGLTRRLSQTLDAMIEPRLDGFQPHVVTVPTGGFILLCEIGGSIKGPHRINFGSKCRFVVRETSYVRDMTYDEIRQSFLKENEASERMRAFRIERCDAVAAEDAATDGAPAKCLVHTVPLSIIRGNQAFDIGVAESDWPTFVNHEWGGGSHIFNLDGFMVYRRSETPSEFVGYCQVYRNGITETCLRASTYWEEGDGIVPALSLCTGIESSIFAASREYVKQGISGAMLIFVSLISVKGHELATGNGYRYKKYLADRDRLYIPDVLVKDLKDGHQIAEVQRFLYDIIWQSFGYAGCTYYDNEGNWRPPR